MVTLLAKNHQHADLRQRERFLAEIRKQVPTHTVFLQTCNRVELYAGDGAVPPGITRHLFRVAAGLESRLIGETAVLGQVRQAYGEATRQRLPRSLHRLFQIALKTGKRVRTETKLSCGSVGHGQAALELIRQQVADISQARIAIIGANRLNQTIIKYLAASACRTVFLSNRTYERALELSQQLGCRVFRLERLREQLLETDVLVSATSAPHAIVRKEDVPRDHALVIVDLAVPRDAEEEIGSLPNIRLFNLDDVERLAWSRREIRAREILAAERIVEEEVEAFYHGEART